MKLFTESQLLAKEKEGDNQNTEELTANEKLTRLTNENKGARGEASTENAKEKMKKDRARAWWEREKCAASEPVQILRRSD